MSHIIRITVFTDYYCISWSLNPKYKTENCFSHTVQNIVFIWNFECLFRTELISLSAHGDYSTFILCHLYSLCNCNDVKNVTISTHVISIRTKARNCKTCFSNKFEMDYNIEPYLSYVRMYFAKHVQYKWNTQTCRSRRFYIWPISLYWDLYCTIIQPSTEYYLFWNLVDDATQNALKIWCKYWVRKLCVILTVISTRFHFPSIFTIPLKTFVCHLLVWNGWWIDV